MIRIFTLHLAHTYAFLFHLKVNENEVEEKLQEDIINEEVERNPVNSENVEPNKQIEKTQHVQRKVTKHTLRI